jgi:hypothetical protein
MVLLSYPFDSHCISFSLPITAGERREAHRATMVRAWRRGVGDYGRGGVAAQAPPIKAV